LRFGQSARAIADKLGDLRLQVAADYYVGLACYNAGDYRQATVAFHSANRLLDGGLSQEHCGLAGFPASMSRSWLAISLANLGAFDEATLNGAEGLRLAEVFDHPGTLIVACRNLASVHALRGELDDAAGLLRRGLTLANDREVADLVPGVMARLGHVLTLSGRTAEGLSLLAEAISLNESMGRRGSHSLLMTYFGEGCVLAGRLEDAQASAGQALAHARERGERGEEAYALRLHGEVASHLNPRDTQTAAAHFLEALALARELGMRPLQAHCHISLSALLRRGAESQAEEHSKLALTLVREIGVRLSTPLDRGGGVPC
jgi:tetratricopeptide (TPR) repeat protein